MECKRLQKVLDTGLHILYKVAIVSVLVAVAMPFRPARLAAAAPLGPFSLGQLVPARYTDRGRESRGERKFGVFHWR